MKCRLFLKSKGKEEARKESHPHKYVLVMSTQVVHVSGTLHFLASIIRVLVIVLS